MARKRKVRVSVKKLPQPKVVTLADRDRKDDEGRWFTPVQPTPERLLKAGLTPVTNLSSRRLQVVENGQVGADGVVRASATSSPLQWLSARGMLDPDPDRNYILKMAGERYYRHWFDGGLKGIGSIDYNRIGGGGSDPSHQTPVSEHAAHHRAEYRQARERMGDWLARIADAVVCEELALHIAAERVCEYAAPKTRAAIAATMLRGGLTTLAEHFGMLSKVGVR